MKTISEINAKDILKEYIEIHEKGTTWMQEDVEHFTARFDNWMRNIQYYSTYGPVEKIPISLNKNNYLGKKTRALLAVMGIKEPRTLRELKHQFDELHR